MKNKNSKRSLLFSLGALSCLSSLQINAQEQSQLKENMLESQKASVSKVTSINAEKKYNAFGTDKVPRNLPPAASVAFKNKQKKEKSSSGGFPRILLCLLLGSGLTLLVQKLFFGPSAEDALDVDGYLWTCVQLTNKYELYGHDNNPSDKQLDKMIYNIIPDELAYGGEYTRYEKKFTSLFASVKKLYSKIIESYEFKKLTFDDSENIDKELAKKQAVLKTIQDILGIPKMHKGVEADQEEKGKWYWNEKDDDHVYVNMPEGSEIIVVSGVEDSKPSRLYWSAKFKKQNGEITFTDFKFEK